MWCRGASVSWLEHSGTPKPCTWASLPPLPPAHRWNFNKMSFYASFSQSAQWTGLVMSVLALSSKLKIFFSLRAASEDVWANLELWNCSEAIPRKKRNAGFLPTALLGPNCTFWELWCSHKELHDVAGGVPGLFMGMSLIVQQILKIINRIVINKNKKGAERALSWISFLHL